MNRGAAVVLTLLVLSACDNRQAFHEPEASLERMLVQKRANAYKAWPSFPDDKAMRHPPLGSVPTDDDVDDPPPPITRDLLALGRARFEKTCAVCHGITGDGVSVVATKMALRSPPSLHEPRIRALSRERIFVVATEGYGLMAGYADLLRQDERWAVAAYVQALQMSRHVSVSALPPAVREELERGAR